MFLIDPKDSLLTIFTRDGKSLKVRYRV